MDFDNLKELARFLNKNLSKEIQLINTNKNKKNKTEQFLQILLDDKVYTEKEAVRKLFKSYDVKYPAYLKLKNRLIQQLKTLTFFVDINHLMPTDRVKAYYSTRKDYATAIILYARKCTRPAIIILEDVLEQAMKYEFVDIAVDVSKLLRNEFKRRSSNLAKCQHYTDLNRDLEKIKNYESMASDYYETLIEDFFVKRSPDHETSYKAINYFEKLHPFVKLINTSAFYFYTYSIRLIHLFSVNRICEALEQCSIMLDYLVKKKNTNRTMILNIAIQKMSCFTHLRVNDTNEINKLLLYFHEYRDADNFNWVRFNEVYFYYCCYTLQYHKSLKIYNETFVDCRLFPVEGIYHDNWLLLGGYLHLLAQLNQLDPQEVESVAGKFRYSKLFNEIEVLKKDKEGMNIPLILLPVLYELTQGAGKPAKEIPVEALEKYRQRWLANDLNSRSNSFFRIVMTLAQYPHLTVNHKKKINREFASIKSQTPEIARQYFAIEVIPYETLTELLLEKMGLSSILDQPQPLAAN
ncbi:MAG: hypothetical protein LCH81_16835 [Bacteroidetes bacterium]|nr:hypothetical protein [Bacteroidota bacterium]